MSLEHPGPGFMGVLGVRLGHDASLYDLAIFVEGYNWCFSDYALDVSDESWAEFLEWLRPKGYFPTGGWAWKIIEECGDGGPAFSRFSELLYEYLECQKPQWFIEFNQVKQPSPWRGISGPRNVDIRFQRHVDLASRV